MPRCLSTANHRHNPIPILLSVRLPLASGLQSSSRPGSCLIHLIHKGWRPASPEIQSFNPGESQRTTINAQNATSLPLADNTASGSNLLQVLELARIDPPKC